MPTAATEPRRALRVHLLGGFEVSASDQLIDLPIVTRRLIALLALTPRPRTRQQLASALWPDSMEPRATANLRSTLWRLGATRDELIAIQHGQLALRPDVAVDVHEMVALCRWLISKAESGGAATSVSLQLVSSELLPGWDDDWVQFERERLRQLSLHALESLSRRLCDAGEYSLAIEAALTAVHLEPLRDSAVGALITAHLREGNRIEAVRRFVEFRERLRRELRLNPSQELRALVADLFVTHPNDLGSS